MKTRMGANPAATNTLLLVPLEKMNNLDNNFTVTASFKIIFIIIFNLPRICILCFVPDLYCTTAF